MNGVINYVLHLTAQHQGKLLVPTFHNFYTGGCYA
jgi:hypothetical protein